MSTEKEQEWRLYFLRNKIVLFYAGEEEENLPFLFDLNASRPIAKGDLKWRDALLVAHRVSSNDFTEDSRRSVLHERERGYAYADRS